MIAWLVVTDGRDDYLTAAVDSGRRHLRGYITERVMFDDTGDAAYRAELARRFPDFNVIDAGPRQGFGGAIRASWAHLRDSEVRFVFHQEQDFTFNEHVELNRMAQVLDRNPHLVQLAMRRQPWNPIEEAAGGIVESDPGAYTEVSDGLVTWLEHRKFFTTNPSLYRRSLCEREWPDGGDSEGRFGIGLCADPEVRFGYWGDRNSAPKVHHIGRERVGTGY